MKRSDQLLLLFSGGDRVGGEAARGLESRDTGQWSPKDGEITHHDESSFCAFSCDCLVKYSVVDDQNKNKKTSSQMKIKFKF